MALVIIFFKRAAFVNEIKTTTQNQKLESATVAVEHSEKTFSKSFYTCKNQTFWTFKST